MNPYKKFPQDVGIIGMTNVVIALRILILLPVITKTLGASGYGLWTQVVVTLSLIAPISDLNLSFAIVRFLAAEKNKREIQESFFSVVIATLCWSAILTVVIILLANSITDFLFHDSALLRVTYIMAVMVPLSALEFACLAFFRAFREMKTYSVFTVSRYLLELALVVSLVLTGYGIWGVVIAMLVARVVIDATMLGIIISRIGIRLPVFSKLKAYLRFCVPMILDNLSSWITGSSDRYVIVFFIGVASVGIYSAAYNLAAIILFFSAPLGIVLTPTLAKLYDENLMNEVRTHLTYSLKYFLMLAIPAVCGISILAKPLLQILSTPEFIPTGALVVPIIALSLLLVGVYVIFSQVFVLIKRTGIIGISWATAALLNLGLNIAFVPRFGVIAAAFATLTSYSLVTAIIVFFSTRHLRFDIKVSFILKSLAASGVMSLIVWKLDPAGIINVIWVIVLGILLYFGSLLLMKGLSLNEIRFFRELFRRG
jgi:O-antigen/teichoic acid export membrane protein